MTTKTHTQKRTLLSLGLSTFLGVLCSFQAPAQASFTMNCHFTARVLSLPGQGKSVKDHTRLEIIRVTPPTSQKEWEHCHVYRGRIKEVQLEMSKKLRAKVAVGALLQVQRLWKAQFVKRAGQVRIQRRVIWRATHHTYKSKARKLAPTTKRSNLLV